MQRRQSILFALAAIITLSSVGIFSVQAQSVTPLTTEHIERIRANCNDARSSLSRLHASDALLRRNRGNLYETILTKLMAPFNGRTTANRLDSVGLITLTADFERELNQFRASYITYDDSVAAIIEANNCTEKPVEFYEAVNSARAKREIVHDHTKKLEEIIVSYQASFETLAKPIEEAK